MKSFTVEQLAPTIAWLETNTPLVNCLTNNVSKNLVANALLAVGASPAMVEAVAEVAAFTLHAAATVINLGALQDDRLSAIVIAAQTAAQNRKLWLLDPAAISPVLFRRSAFARELLQFSPSIIRGNAAEILFLAGQSALSRGADSLNRSDEAIAAAQHLAQQQKCVVVVSGKEDYVTDGKTLFRISGGDAQMARVTGTGCALSAIIAAFACAPFPQIETAAAACLLMKKAGEYAAQHSQGLGSFALALLDGLTIRKA